MSAFSNSEKTDYLSIDEPIAGQSFVCLSFLSPEKALKDKVAFAFEKFLETKNISMGEYEQFLSDNEERLNKEHSETHNFQTTVRGVKVRGVYQDFNEAKQRAEQVRRMDANFDVFVGPVGYWLPWDPSPDGVGDQEYMESNLNELMSNYRKNCDSKNQHFREEVAERIELTRADGQRGKDIADENNEDVRDLYGELAK